MKPIKMTMALLFIALYFPNVSIACSCAGDAGKFMKYATTGNGVIRAEVIGYGPRLEGFSSSGEMPFSSMIVDVSEVIMGNFTGRELTLIGDPGNLCRPYVTPERYAIGSEYLISIINDKSTQPLAGCGESSVIVVGDSIEGRERTANGTIPYTLNLQDSIKLLKDRELLKKQQLETGYLLFESKSYKEAFDLIQTNAGNEPKAQQLLGEMYEFGWGVSKDNKKAIGWYRNAGFQGSISSQRALGIVYSEGTLAPRDYKESAYWNERAAKQGDHSAQIALAEQYCEGKGVDEDLKKCAYWVKKGHDLRLPIASEIWEKYGLSNYVE